MNFEIEIPKDIKTEEQAQEYIQNYELPSGYVEDSFEFIKFIAEDSEDLI